MTNFIPIFPLNLVVYPGETLNLHINLAPTGFSQADLLPGMQDSPVIIASADLLAGFSDPEGAPLTVVDLYANTGGTIIDVCGGLPCRAQ